MKAIYTAMAVVYVAIVILFAVWANGTPMMEKDKIVHFTAFLILTLVLQKTLSFYKVKRPFIIVLLTSFTIALMTEFLQIFTSTRQPSALDLLADFAGIGLAMVLR